MTIEEKKRKIEPWSIKEFGIGGPYHKGNFESKENSPKYSGEAEIYQSYFNFEEDIKKYYNDKKSVGGYAGSISADSIIIDIDCENKLEEALKITKELVTDWESSKKISHFKIFFSGNKGFHLELPSELFDVFMPQNNLHLIHKEIAKKLVEEVIEKYRELEKKIGKQIFDISIYKRTGFIRVNNTLNTKSGLFKIELSRDELFSLDIDKIKELAKTTRTVSHNAAVIERNIYLTDLYLRIKARYSGKEIEEYVSEKDDNVIINEIDYKRISEVKTHCSWFREIIERTNLNNDERVRLANLLLPFGEEGEEYLRSILAKQNNYDEAKTNYHLGMLIRGEYKPPRCENFCSIYPCKPIKNLSKNSPVAFAYISKLKKFVESIIVDRFLKSHPFLIYSLNEEEFYEYTNGIYRKLQENELKGQISSYMNFLLTAANIKVGQINAVYERLKTVENIHFSDEFNTGRIINLKNGIYDLEKQRFVEHSPSLHHTIQLNFKYDEKAKAPKFEAFLNDIFEENKEKIDFVLKMICYFLFSDYSFQKIFVFFGKGRNGKGILSRIIKELLGENNFEGIPMHTLIKSDTAPYLLKNKLLNISSELSTKDAEVGMLKSLSGNDTITSNRKYKEWVSFENKAKLLILTNHLPRFSEIDTAVMERFVMITFLKSYTGKDDNTSLFDELKYELSGIFNVVVAKYKEIVGGEGAIKFSIPESIQKDLSILLREVSSVGEFIYEKCSFNESSELPIQDLYKEYKDYCNENGYHPLGNRKFKSSLETFENVEIKRRNYGYVVSGVSINKCEDKFFT
ncbi:MAG: DUF5906 domain-containing protein [Melioribacteraceae bacterium]|nr:DUF5906 domain-containing protein [Melioribacteraceae bacterium]MCF8395718.1 DUF5906 domain-containing protein [Melioribacteraceae bacterium]MCF8421210.1 DUF5906 domain-containing protein [Melioribacteraceae bacterium]